MAKGLLIVHTSRNIGERTAELVDLAETINLNVIVTDHNEHIEILEVPDEPYELPAFTALESSTTEPGKRFIPFQDIEGRTWSVDPRMVTAVWDLNSTRSSTITAEPRVGIAFGSMDICCHGTAEAVLALIKEHTRA